jgi:hydrogenase nickel incorporation protein HypB
MCEDCGCGDKELVSEELQVRILSANERRAKHNREHFERAGVLAINLMGSPGSGKTALLEALAKRLAGRVRIAAVSGDLATDRDAQRLSAAGISAASITTGSACHLDAEMVHRALDSVAWSDAAYFFIENVGNLVCPAVYDLGQALNVVVLSVTEGADKPLKYPVMFHKADLVVLTKCDLLPYLPDLDLDELEGALVKVMPTPAMIAVSARTGAAIDDWVAWLEGARRPDALRPNQNVIHPVRV